LIKQQFRLFLKKIGGPEKGRCLCRHYNTLVSIFYETDSMAVVSRSEWKLRLNEESKSESFRIIQERQLIISWQWRSPTLAGSSPVIYSWPSETTRNWINPCLVSPLPRVVTVFSQTSRPFCQKRHRKPSNKQVDCSVYTNNGHQFFSNLKVLHMAAKTEFVLITFSHMCFSNDSSESIVTPLSFYS
jgi:hypothetical protein